MEALTGVSGATHCVRHRWGENLAGVKAAPVKLSDQQKLVYTPHTYGPGVFMQSYFSDARFPANMEAVWEAHFAFVQRSTGQPIVIGEIGGTYVGLDRQWQDWAISQVKKRGMGIFYFCLNPDSKDTGGLLLDDWTTVNAAKIELLSSLASTDVRAMQPQLPPPSPPPPATAKQSPPPPSPEAEAAAPGEPNPPMPSPPPPPTSTDADNAFTHLAMPHLTTADAARPLAGGSKAIRLMLAPPPPYQDHSADADLHGAAGASTSRDGSTWNGGAHLSLLLGLGVMLVGGSAYAATSKTLHPQLMLLMMHLKGGPAVRARGAAGARRSGCSSSSSRSKIKPARLPTHSDVDDDDVSQSDPEDDPEEDLIMQRNIKQGTGYKQGKAKPPPPPQTTTTTTNGTKTNKSKSAASGKKVPTSETRGASSASRAKEPQVLV